MRRPLPLIVGGVGLGLAVLALGGGPAPAPAAAGPAASPEAERGQYLVRIMGCNDVTHRGSWDQRGRSRT